MARTNRQQIGCNVIDPLLEVKGGSDYSLEIMRRSLEFLKDLGHDAVEYSHASHFKERELAAVRKMTQELGLSPWSLHAWCGGDVLDAAAAAVLTLNLGIAVHAAEGLGVGIVVHHPTRASLNALDGGGQRRLEAEAELLAEVLRPGIRFALENASRRDSMEYLIALVDLLGPERAGVCVDTGHAVLGDLGPGTAIRMAGHRLITTHLHDNDGTSDQHRPPGDGIIDWDDVARALREAAYEGCVMLELTDQPSADRRPTTREELARGAEAARRLRDAVWAVL